MSKISSSVGYGGVNNLTDVITVQLLLNHFISFDKKLAASGISPLVADGIITSKWDKSDRTIRAIMQFQRLYKKKYGMSLVDGRVDKNGKTIRALCGGPKSPKASTSYAAVTSERSETRSMSFVGGWGSAQYQYGFEGTYDNSAYN